MLTIMVREIFLEVLNQCPFEVVVPAYYFALTAGIQ